MKKYNEKTLNEIRKIEAIFQEGIKIINKDTQEYKYIKWYVNDHYSDLCDCYNSYSSYKESAYNKYLKIYRKLLDEGYSWEGFGINTFNSNQFTLSMEVSKDNIYYKIYITKVHNKIIAYGVGGEEA